MIPEIKKLHSPDVKDLKAFSPRKDDNFCILIQLIAGPKDDKTEESFDFILCSPRWIMENYKENDIVIGHHYLIGSTYSYNSLYDSLQSLCKKCESETWDECAEKLSRYGKWEFDDYIPIKK